MVLYIVERACYGFTFTVFFALINKWYIASAAVIVSTLLITDIDIIAAWDRPYCWVVVGCYVDGCVGVGVGVGTIVLLVVFVVFVVFVVVFVVFVVFVVLVEFVVLIIGTGIFNCTNW